MEVVAESQFDNLCCLVVDDDKFSRSFIKTALYQIGIKTIKEAASASEAVEILRNFNVNLVLLDQIMEEKTGEIGRTLVVFASPLGVVGKFRPVSQLRRNFSIQGVSLHVILAMAAQTVLVEEVAADEELDFLGTSAHADIVLMRRDPILVEFLDPVDVVIGSFVPFRPDVSSCDGGMLELAVHVILDVLHVRIIEDRASAVIDVSGIEHGGEIIGIGHVRHTDGIVETHVSGIADIGPSGLSALGGYKDDTECGTGTVDGRRGCVLQN